LGQIAKGSGITNARKIVKKFSIKNATDII